MAASDGGIFAFGDAGFFGSTGAIKLAKRIQQMAATPSGKGYWMVAGDGGIFSFGDASFYGSAVDGGAEKRIVDIAPSATGKGYYITASNGAVFAYGDAKFYGGAEGQKLAHGIIAMVPINNGEPPLASNDTVTIDEDGTAVIDVLANDRDPDGGVLSIASVAPALHGGATVVDGRITYRPTFNYSGTDTFSYTVIDSNGLTAVGLVTVTIRPMDDLPRAIDDAKTVQIGQTVTIDVLGNDGGLGDGLFDLVDPSAPAHEGHGHQVGRWPGDRLHADQEGFRHHPLPDRRPRRRQRRGAGEDHRGGRVAQGGRHRPDRLQRRRLHRRRPRLRGQPGRQRQAHDGR